MKKSYLIVIFFVGMIIGMMIGFSIGVTTTLNWGIKTGLKLAEQNNISINLDKTLIEQYIMQNLAKIGS